MPHISLWIFVDSLPPAAAQTKAIVTAGGNEPASSRLMQVEKILENTFTHRMLMSDFTSRTGGKMELAGYPFLRRGCSCIGR
jgi:hypothetical protein